MRKCIECKKMLSKPKMNKSGYCSNCLNKVKYARKKTSSQVINNANNGGENNG